MAISHPAKTLKRDKLNSSQKAIREKAAVFKSGKSSQSSSSKPPSNWLGHFTLHLSIAKKIGYGYAVAIGIAVLGTTVGWVMGDYYQKEAREQLIFADEQQQLLRDLEKALVAVRSHPQRLTSVLGKSILFEYESAKFLGEVTQFETRISEVESFINSHSQKLAIERSEFNNLLQGYETNTEAYAQLVKSLWQQIDPANLTTEQIPAARQQVLVATSGEIAIKIDFKFERLTESLNRILAASETQKAQSHVRLARSEALRLQIIVVSMLLSGAIATALAYHTSRAIARPLEAVTDVARAIVKEGNFALQAPVSTEDEVGSLATSLNQLVQWVGEYTHQLELSRHTLEQRVEERTRELKQAVQNLKQTQSQLIQTEKMSSLGQLVAGVAHEINNPVNFIYGNINHANDYTRELFDLLKLYQEYHPNPAPEIQERIEEIDLEFLQQDLPNLLSSMKMGTERIRQIVLSLRNFSRLDESEMKAVDIHEGIDNTLLILNHRIKHGIEIIKQYGDLPPVSCYPAQLNQVFMNIISNAIDALEEGDVSEKLGRKSTIWIQTQRVNNEILVSLRDNGSGIPAEIQGKLFDPFFTTKDVGKGTGLGLSICYQIIEKHRGKIEVISDLGRGTEFAIALPIN